MISIINITKVNLFNLNILTQCLISNKLSRHRLKSNKINLAIFHSLIEIVFGESLIAWNSIFESHAVYFELHSCIIEKAESNTIELMFDDNGFIDKSTVFPEQQISSWKFH